MILTIPILASGLKQLLNSTTSGFCFSNSSLTCFSLCPQGVLDRFSQIQPKLIFSVEAVVYNGKEHNHLEKLLSVVKGISLHTIYLIP